MLRHYFELEFIEAEKIKIDFLDKHSKKINKTAIAALDSLLTVLFHLKENEDYEIIQSKYESIKQCHIIIKRQTNILLVLNFLLNDKNKFVMRPVQKLDVELEKWEKYFLKIMMGSIGNKNIPRKEYEKIYPIILKCLNDQYEMLKKEKVTKSLKLMPENNFDDLLCHPLYQTLSLLKADHKIRKEEYKDKQFYEKFFAKNEKFEIDSYDEVFGKYKVYVPTCYCDRMKDDSFIISEEKIKRSLNEPDQQHPIRGTQSSPEVSRIETITPSSVRAVKSLPPVSSPPIKSIPSIFQPATTSSEVSHFSDNDSLHSTVTESKSSPGLLGSIKILPSPKDSEKKKPFLGKSL